MSIILENYRINKKEVLLANSVKIDITELANCAAMTNQYLNKLYELFNEMNFNLFEILGQRNISGVVGEIFSRFFCMQFNSFEINPHPDGRPDIICLADKKALKYFLTECFQVSNGRKTPIKTKFTPFPHGGLEVKCTIGDPKSNYKEMLKKDTGKNSFEIGMPRINYLNKLNYWAHHRHSSNLFGLYYDYYAAQNNNIQILAAFYVNLTPEDWSIVSIGAADKKKTSNTSLNAAGIKKLNESCLLLINDKKYVDKFRAIGITL